MRADGRPSAPAVARTTADGSLGATAAHCSIHRSHLHERVGVDVTDVEPGALVLRSQLVEVHAPMVADASASIRHRGG